MRLFAMALSLFFIASTPALSEVFTWTDAKGTAHFTDNRANIPAQYRKKAVSMESDDAAPQTPPPSRERSRPERRVVSTEGTSARPERGEDQSPVAVLARSLTQGAASERDRAYAIFSWIRSNIYYDNNEKWQRRYGQSSADQSPEGVLASKRGVCAGMANLFAELTQKAGLRSVVVTGRASGMRQEPHAWNAVMIDGKWQLVDLTRHSFLSPPEEFIARHFPSDPQWQLLDKPLSYDEWLKR